MSEIEEAALAAQAEDPAANTRQWLLETHVATLCTTAARRGIEGAPFGSVVPFAIDAMGRPLILIASIAAHTANLKRDPRGTLFVRQPGLDGDPQRGWRVGLIGEWAPIPECDHEEAHARYVQRVPFADGYLATHGFQYWRLETLQAVRYIAGFGKICWVEPDDILRDPYGHGIADAAAGAIAHMNEDHAHNMVEMCTGLCGFTPESAEMTELDRTGFFVKTTGPDRTVYFPFGREIDAAALRVAVVDVLKRARA